MSLPPGAEVWAASDFTPFAGLAWPGERAISLQPHPEFEPAYAISLIEHRRERDLYADDRLTGAWRASPAPDDGPGSAAGSASSWRRRLCKASHFGQWAARGAALFCRALRCSRWRWRLGAPFGQIAWGGSSAVLPARAALGQRRGGGLLVMAAAIMEVRAGDWGRRAAARCRS